MKVLLNSYDLGTILSSPPVITDQLNAVCRVLEIEVASSYALDNFLGQVIQLYYGTERWFIGILRKRLSYSDKTIRYAAYDPLYFFKKNPDDWYFRNQTATQAIEVMADASGIRISNLANTGVVFSNLYYPGKDPDVVAVDLLARTYQQSEDKYWFRYNPSENNEGLQLFKREVPREIWVFQTNVNLISASYEQSIEDTINIVKYVNRDTGKVVIRKDDASIKRYGPTKLFEEIDKDNVGNMENLAAAKLEELNKIKTTMKVEGINPNAVMPQFYSGDVIYVEERFTGLVGAYHILNVVQTFEGDNLIKLEFDIQAAPDIPAIKVDDATETPEQKQHNTNIYNASDTGKGVQQLYSNEVESVIESY